MKKLTQEEQDFIREEDNLVTTSNFASIVSFYGDMK